jgi:hypothetical protein
MSFPGIAKLSDPSRFAQWVLILCVPIASLLILGRHIYLTSKHDLSTWKGGGMGMFADADGLQNRYAKVFVVEPGGRRNPLTQFSPEQVDLLNRALEYPVRKNFLRAARRIAQENWTATHQRTPVMLFDVKGEPLGPAAESFYIMVPYGRPSGDDERKWDMQIQFWKIAYDPTTKRAHVVLGETFVFRPEELWPKANQTKS